MAKGSDEYVQVGAIPRLPFPGPFCTKTVSMTGLIVQAISSKEIVTIDTGCEFPYVVVYCIGVGQRCWVA